MSPQESLNRYFGLDPTVKQLPNAIIDALGAAPGERLQARHDGLPSTLRYTVAVSAISFFAIKRLVLPTYEGEAPKPYWATAAAPIARTFIEAITNLLYILENPTERVNRYIKAGVCRELARHQRLCNRHAGDPRWQEHLVQLKAWIEETERLAPLSESEKSNFERSAKSLWPNPGSLISQCSDEAKSYLMFLKDWYYDELSQDAHLSYMGLVRRGQMLNEVSLGLPQEAYRTSVFYGALALYLALLSEVAAAAVLPRESRQLEFLWQNLSAFENVAPLWTERYEALLQGIS